MLQIIAFLLLLSFWLVFHGLAVTGVMMIGLAALVWAVYVVAFIVLRG